MWFKNSHIYQLPKNFKLSADEIAERLSNKRFITCGRTNDKTIGWVSPIHRNHEYLVHAAGGCILFCMRKEQKVIPASAVKEAVEEKITLLQDELGRKIYSKEKKSIKDDIVSMMLPNAFARSTHVRAYFDTMRKLLVIDSSSAAQVDEFYELLIESIGSFGALPLTAAENPSLILNQWILKSPPKEWMLNGEYLLKDPKDDRVARFKDHDVSNPFVADLLADGYSTSRLGIQFKEQLSAIIQESLQISSLKFEQKLLNENDELKGEDALLKFDADFALMTGCLGEFIEELQNIFIKEIKEQ